MENTEAVLNICKNLILIKKPANLCNGKALFFCCQSCDSHLHVSDLLTLGHIMPPFS